MRLFVPLTIVLAVQPSELPAQAPGSAPADKPAKHAAWQYRVLNAYQVQDYDPQHKASPEGGLNSLGREGWELIAIVPGVPRPTSVAAADNDVSKPVHFVAPPLFYFKRPYP